MTYKSINADRFRYLLTHAVDAQGWKKFFSDNRASLIISGAKAQNPPSKIDDQVSLLLRFSEKSLKILERYIRENIRDENGITVSEIIERFKKCETDSPEKLPEKESRQLSRVTLGHLFSDDCPIELLTYLRMPIPGSEDVSKSVGGIPLQKSRAVVNLTEDPELKTFYLGAMSALEGRSVDLAGYIDKLSGRPEMLRVLNLIEARSSSKKLKGDHGVSILPSVSWNADYEIEEIRAGEIIGVCIESKTEFAFVEVIGLPRLDKLVVLDREELQEVFPHRGELICFSNTPNLKLPQKNEVVVWHVEELQTDKQIKWKIVPPARSLFEVYELPFFSDQIDSVRSALQAFKPVSANRSIFLLRDGALIKPRADIRDFAKHTYDDLFDGWNYLQGYRWKSRTFVLSPLRKPDFTYDCSPIENTLKRLLRFDGVRQLLPQFSRAQLIQLVDLVKTHANEVDTKRLGLVKGELEKYIDDSASISELFSLILQRPEIQAELGMVKELAIAELKGEKNEIVMEIERLRKDKNELEGEIRERRSRATRFPDDLKRSIAESIRSAKDDVPRLLADSILFEAIENKISSRPDLALSQPPALCKFLVNDREDIENETSIFEGFEISKGSAKRFLRALKISIDTGLIIIIKGMGAGIFSKKLSNLLSHARFGTFDVPVGLIDSLNCLQVAEKNNCDLICLQRFCSSDVELYAFDLIDAVTERILYRLSTSNLKIIFVGSSSPASLPVPLSVRKLSFLLDLDRLAEPLDEGIVDGKFGEAERDGTAWGVLRRRVLGELDKLDEDERLALMPIFHRGLTGD